MSMANEEKRKLLEEVVKLVKNYPSKMREAPVYYYDSDIMGRPQPIPFWDFMSTPDVADAKELGVVLLAGDKWHWYSDIRNDEQNDTLDAAIGKALEPLITEILSLEISE